MKKIILFYLIFILLYFSCQTVQQAPAPVPAPAAVPEPAPVLRSTVVFNAMSNPTTGFDWEIWIDYNSTGRFALNNLQVEEIYPGAMGSPQKQAHTLRSSQAGRVFVHFIYKRPWEGGETIGRYIYTFDIANDLTITLINTEKTINRGYKESDLPVIEIPVINNRSN